MLATAIWTRSRSHRQGSDRKRTELHDRWGHPAGLQRNRSYFLTRVFLFDRDAGAIGARSTLAHESQRRQRFSAVAVETRRLDRTGAGVAEHNRRAARARVP